MVTRSQLSYADPQESSFGWSLVSDSTGPFERVQRRELEATLDECLAELPDHFREVILLRSYAGMDWAEIAMELGKPTKQAAEQLFQRARGKLIEKLNTRIPDDE